MKFGEQLRSSVIREYQWYYIDYDGLKDDLKNASGPVLDTEPGPSSASKGKGKSKNKNKPAQDQKTWSEEDEQRFIAKLYNELEKVYTKTKVKQSEIQRRIAVSDKEVKQVVSKVTERGLNEQGPPEEDFILLEDDLSDIIADVHDLAKFVQLNYTGFYKIIKKHDKMTNWHLRPSFDAALKRKPFYNEDFDSEVIRLSKLYDLVRTRGNPVQGDSAAGGSQGSFVRQTTKYWVHPDNITEVKLIILKHLPVLVFNANKEFDAADSAITSIYYDNTDKWDLYEGRLKKTEGAEAIRLRWYGGMQSDQIFVERKTHREDWTGEQSVKARFSMKEKNVNAYLRGDLLPQAIFEKARKEGKKSAKQLDEDEQLAREIQYSVLKKQYKPVCRSFYHRTAFQLPADARVRISLDTELTMVREDNLDGRKRAGDNWRRMDIGIDWPFNQLPDEDVVRFPYAVLEVKLQTQHGQEPPEWIRSLIASHLVEAVPKFSKFIHGTATMFPTRIKLLPYWMPQMDVDIRKPVSHSFGIRRRAGMSSASGTTSDDDETEADTDLDEDDEEDEDDDQPRRNHTTNGHGSARNGSTQAVTDMEEQTTGSAVPVLEEDYPLYDSDNEDEDDALEEARRVGGWPYYSALADKYAKVAGRKVIAGLSAIAPHPRGSEVPRSNRVQMFFGNQEVSNKRIKAPKGKKIYVPVRVEPKVYFAAERTFLSWLEFSIYVGTIAVTLLNFGTKPTTASLVISGVFTLLAISALCYSVGIYLYRSRAIRERRVVKFYDRYGTTALCLAVVCGIVLNFAFEGRERNLW
ncbi:VTC domain-containing protein [Microdochium trichocladiopsis]|uniref:Vacuolar transporter chaperone complex subunit 4 n=1 Tax=Microdochium trichocladiopsis TaxID=1682393 RepID=A0A9P8YDE8_9PEZI|nr:VTC domain-containing protein [Microdochium trichocladiopsis]KAH7034827.1 VTC domain-containing protein [Microdochium trichocladiopsis]